MDSHSWETSHTHSNPSHSIGSIGTLPTRPWWNKTFSSPAYLLAILWMVSLFRMIDMQVIAVLMEPIKSEFHFSDTQLGMLSGMSFALVYSLLGLPIAWLADRYNRVTIISFSLAIWSLMTLLCGQAIGFASFFIARMGVGIGEAGGYAPAVALLADNIKENKRGRAFAILGSAIPCGVFVSFLIGSLILEASNWRMVYMVVGLPGIFLALTMVLSLKDRKRKLNPDLNKEFKIALLFKSLGELLAQPILRWLLIAAAFCMLAATGSGIWMPSFFMRVHGFSIAQTGIYMAFLYGGGGLLGTLLGGWLADKWSQQNQSQAGAMRLCSVSVLAVIPCAMVVLFAASSTISLIAIAGMIILMHMNVGPVLGLVQLLADKQHRAMAQAVNILLSSLFGLGCGSLIVGAISDAMTPDIGVLALPIGMFAVLGVGYGAAWYCFRKAAEQYENNPGEKCDV